MKKCKSCNGTGRYYYNPQADDQTCMECHGRGMILTERELIQEKIDLINKKIKELEQDKENLQSSMIFKKNKTRECKRINEL